MLLSPGLSIQMAYNRTAWPTGLAGFSEGRPAPDCSKALEDCGRHKRHCAAAILTGFYRYDCAGLLLKFMCSPTVMPLRQPQGDLREDHDQHQRQHHDQHEWGNRHVD